MAKYTMQGLKEKYAEFSAPYYAIKINDREVEQRFCKEEITIELTSGYDAGSCSFSISNAFLQENGEKLKLKEELKQALKLGNKVEAYVGYRTGGLTKVFTGYIDTLYLDYDKDEGIFYTVECLDGKGIMMNSIRSEAKVSFKKYSDAVEGVLKLYSAVLKISSQGLDKTDSEIKTQIEQHGESDYDFVVRLAKKINYCFYIENGAVVFKPFSKLPKDVFFSFDINFYMLEFKMMNRLKNMVSSVTVRANNEKDPSAPFESKITGCKGRADNSSVNMRASSVITGDVSQTVTDLAVDSVETAKKFAEAKFSALSSGFSRGKVKVLGVPELFPGRTAEIFGFGSGFDGKYFLKKVIHKIKDNRFTTECELEADKQ